MASMVVALRILTGIFFTFFVSFIVAGYQALLPVLIEEGVYSYKCLNNATNETNLDTSLTFQSNKTCAEQKLAYVSVY